MPLFRADSEDEGRFVIKTLQEDEEFCTIEFHHDMGGAIDYKTQKAMIQKFAESLQKTCYSYWSKQE